MIKIIEQIAKSTAYIDPGTGSIIIQATIAALVGGLYFLKTQWSRIKQFFKKGKKNE